MLNFDFLEKGLRRKRSSRAGNFDTLSDAGDNYESAIEYFEYFMPKKNLLYEHHNFLSARQN